MKGTQTVLPPVFVVQQSKMRQPRRGSSEHRTRRKTGKSMVGWKPRQQSISTGEGKMKMEKYPLELPVKRSLVTFLRAIKMAD